MNLQRTAYIGAGLAIIVTGVASRVFRSGLPAIDKYLGDALYAALVYILLGIVRPNAKAGPKALLALAIMLAIELFQLTRIPAQLARSGQLTLKLIAIGLGTSWSWYDLLAYAAGILSVYLLDRWLKHAPIVN